MGSVERRYTKLLSKAIFKSMRKYRISFLVIGALMVIRDFMTRRMSFPINAVDQDEFLPYTFILLGLTFLILAYETWVKDCYGKFTFIPKTPKIHYLASILCQFGLLLIGQLTGIACYLIQYTLQVMTGKDNARLCTIVYPNINAESLLKGLLLNCAVGLVVIMGLHLFRIFFRYYQSVTVVILMLLSVVTFGQMIVFQNNSCDYHYILSYIGYFFFSLHTVQIKIVKLVVLCLGMFILTLFLLMRDKIQFYSRTLYWMQITLFMFCFLFVISRAGWFNDNWHIVEFDNYRREQFKVADGKGHEKGTILNIKDVTIDTHVILQPYKDNDGDNSIYAITATWAEVDEENISDKMKVKMINEKETDHEMNLKVERTRIMVKNVFDFKYSNFRVELFHIMNQYSTCNYEQRLIIRYPDTIDWKEVHVYDDEGIECKYSYFNEYIEGNSDPMVVPEKLE